MKRKTNKKANIVHYYRTKIALSLILGLIGGASWVYTIQTTSKALASVLEPKKYVYENAPLKEEKPLKASILTPTDCYSSAEKYAPFYHVDVELLKRIIQAESGNNTNAENLKSTAKGCFQWISGTWKHYSIELWGKERFEKNPFNFSDNTELAAYVISKYGLDKARSEWKESAYIWDK